MLKDPEYVRGIPCVPLNYFLQAKKEGVSAKDTEDVALIERYLSAGGER